MIKAANSPERIICLTVETTEVLYLLGEQDRICGISGFTVRPPQARREKPKVSAFTSARIDKVLALNPDLVLGYSDLQAPIAAELVQAGIEVHIFNHCSVQGILNMIQMIGAMVKARRKADLLNAKLRRHLESIESRAATLRAKPKIYFEEWNDPLISGIGWVSELIEMAGGTDCFPEIARQRFAKGRIISDPAEVINRAPDIIIGSWCGKRFRPDHVAARPGWNQIPAVCNGHVYEIKSCDILQAGPAALTDGVSQIHDCVRQWHAASAERTGASG